MLDPSLSLDQKGLYGLIAAITMENQPVTMADLARRAGCGRTTLRRYLAELITYGYVIVGKSGPDQRYHTVVLTEEASDRSDALIKGIVRRLSLARKRIREEHSKESVGEALMKEWLTLLIAESMFTDNARPGFMINPLTGERLEYDRRYPALKLAWEFHGPHHFQHADPTVLAKQQANDMVKIGRSQREGITLIEVKASDLRLDRMVALIPPSVPRRSLEGLGEVVTFLEAESAHYRREPRGHR